MNKYRGGMIGCGFFAQHHVDGWRRMPDVELVAAADTDVERARRAAPRAYSSAGEMLDQEQLDFVDIATRPDTHLPLVRLCVSRAIPVICQKPMAPDWSQAVAMVEAAATAGVRLMIHENWRWQPWYRRCHEILTGGGIGRPIGYWFRTRRRDGLGPAPYANQPYFSTMPRLLIYETLVHHMDTARFLFGDILSVFAQARRVNPQIKGEDQVLMLLEHEGGLPGTIDGHRFLGDDTPVMGEAAFEGDEAALYVSTAGDVYRGTECLWRNDIAEGYRGDSVRATQQHFIDCLRQGDPFESEGRDYLRKTFAAVEAAYLSIEERRAVSPEPRPPGSGQS